MKGMGHLVGSLGLVMVLGMMGCPTIPPPPAPLADEEDAGELPDAEPDVEDEQAPCEVGAPGCPECAVDADCAQGSCVEGACVEDERPCPTVGSRCEGEVRVTCTAVGQEPAREDCAQVGLLCALAGGQTTCIAPACEVGAVECASTESLQRCQGRGAAWTVIPCENNERCLADEDGARCAPVICTPGARDCDGPGVARVCNETGTARVETACGADAVCEDGTCRQLACVPGLNTCMGNVAVLCDDRGENRTLINCAETTPCQDSAFGCLCREGVCRVRACAPGTVRCDGLQVQSCVEDGARFATIQECNQDEVCLEGVCVAKACEPSSVVCDGETLVLCDPFGTGFTTEDCALGQGLCRDAGLGPECGPPVCEPDVARCNGQQDAVLRCDARGAQEVATPCRPDELCSDARCQTVACEPGDAPVCLDGDVKRCSNDGLEFVLVDDCLDGEVCVGAQCLPQVCTPSEARCEGEELQVCDRDGVELTRRDCAAEGGFCNQDAPACRPRVCEPGVERRCVNGDSFVCDDRGTGLELAENCGARPCSAGQCETLPLRAACLRDGDCDSNHCAVGVCAPEGFALVEAGSFQMGSPDGEAGRVAEEGPRHQVTLTRDLWVMETEVTQALWSALMGGRNPSVFRDDPSRPVETVSWFDALAFANALSLRDGLTPCYGLGTCSGTPGFDYFCAATPTLLGTCDGYRLPTEAEWEYSARAGTATAFHAGGISQVGCERDDVLDLIGWYCGNAGGRTHPVGEKLPNAWGLHDMSGNVFEWVQDIHDENYYDVSPRSDPPGPTSGSARISRGGSWNFFSRSARSAFRQRSLPQSRFEYIGFRLVRLAP